MSRNLTQWILAGAAVAVLAEIDTSQITLVSD